MLLANPTLESQVANFSRLGSGWRPPDAGASEPLAVITPWVPGTPCLALRAVSRLAYTAPGMWEARYCSCPACGFIRSNVQSKMRRGVADAIRACSCVAEI